MNWRSGPLAATSANMMLEHAPATARWGDRVSNFLTWQLACAEMLFVEKYWPDFEAEDLTATLAEFRRRDRRVGATGQDVQHGRRQAVAGSPS